MWTAERVKKLRKRLGLSQQVMAGLLKVTQKAVSAWEVGHTQPNRWLQERLSALERETTHERKE